MIRLDKGAVTGHAGFGIGTAILLAGLAGARYSAQAQERKGYPVWWFIIEVAAALLVTATMVTGHLL
jgi:uncharacterized membrane protein